MARVLVTEKIAQSGLDLLAEAGHEVDVQEGLSPEELLVAIVGAHALIIRSSTQVTADVLDAGTSLEVVGRAGVGLDNVDVERGDAAGGHGGQCPDLQHPLGGRAGHGAPPGPGPQHPPGPRRVGGGALGALEVGGRRAPRQGPRRGRAGPGRLAGGPTGPCLRHGADRLRPLRLGGAGQGHGHPLGGHRGAGGGGGLRLHPHAQDTRDDRALRARPAGQGQARHPDHQHRPGWHRRRRGVGRRHSRRHRGRGRARRLRQGAVHRIPPVLAAPGRRVPASRGVDRGGAGQGRGDHRRAGAAGAGRRLRALCGQRGRHGRLGRRATLHAPGRAAGSLLRRASTTACPTAWRSSARASWRR